MSGTVPRRALVLKLAVLNLLAGAVLFLAPNLVQRAYAYEPDTCSVSCRNGSCRASGSCTCTCSYWTGSPVCSCGGGGEQQEAPGDTVAT